MARSPVSHSEFLGLMESVSNWNRWGPEDQRGTLNYITPERVRASMALVREGITLGLSHSVVDPSALGQADSQYPAVHLMKALGNSNTDYLALMIHGPQFTHIDALCHHSWEGKMYNGTPASAVTASGAKSNGVGVMRDGIVGRGVLLDIAHSEGVPWLEPGEAIGPEELERAEAVEKVEVGEGDILFIGTGRERRRREVGPWSTRQQAAGLHPYAMPWLHERRVALVALDGVVEVFPSVVEGLRLPIHTLALTAMGLHVIDNIAVERLSAECSFRGRWEFMAVISPLRIEQGTGSPVNPLAIF